jgi:hypothetical protein
VPKNYQRFYRETVRASGLWEKELEFLDREFWKMNYWRKVENMIFGKTMWGARYKLLGR